MLRSWRRVNRNDGTKHCISLISGTYAHFGVMQLGLRGAQGGKNLMTYWIWNACAATHILVLDLACEVSVRSGFHMDITSPG